MLPRAVAHVEDTHTVADNIEKDGVSVVALSVKKLPDLVVETSLSGARGQRVGKISKVRNASRAPLNQAAAASELRSQSQRYAFSSSASADGMISTS